MLAAAQAQEADSSARPSGWPQRVFQNAGLGGGGPPVDAPLVDTSEQVYISSLALLKMLKHGASGRSAKHSYI